MIALAIVVAIALLVALYVMTAYNALVRGRNLAGEAQSGMDVQLKRRADLIPNLVAAVKGYMEHERGVLEDIAQLRSRIATTPDTATRYRLEGELTQALSRFLAVAENYPQLRASENFASLQTELAAVEEALQLSRRYYNGAARDQNNRVQSFPSNFIASSFGFTTRPYFELENPADRAVPTVSFTSGGGA
jgi:LemA protein